MWHQRACARRAGAITWSTGDGPHAHYAVVTVQTHRDVSTAVATRLGVRHETPQALLIVDGRVVWSASHYRVTAESIAKAIQSHHTADLRRP